MNKRKLGKLEVSAIGMGCMGFSHGYGAIPEEEYSIEAIRDALAHGCTFFDTAEGYGPNLEEPGHNEKILGKSLKGSRDQAIIATKLHLDTEEARANGVYETLKKPLLGSLERLQTDYVDLYYLHQPTYDIPVEEIAEGMGRLIDEGLIRGYGLSNVDTDYIRRAHTIRPVTAVQNIYSMLERDCEESIIPFCEASGIGFVPFSPIASGFLSGKITPETQFESYDDVRNVVPQLTRENIAANQPIVEVLKKFGEQKNATPAQLSLAWMLHKYPHVVPIPGSKNKGRILENLAADEVILSEAEFEELENALNACTVHGHRGLARLNLKK